MLTKLVRKAVLGLLPEIEAMLKEEVLEALLLEISGVYKLDSGAQYMIVVQDDETAQELVQAINQTFKPESRIIVLAAKGVKIVEITKGG